MATVSISIFFESAPEPGGMAGHLDFDGISLERFYHFVCKTDTPTFALLAELGIADKIHWRKTSMGLLTRGELFRWGDPLALLRFPHLTFLQKLRYGVFAYVCAKRDHWPGIENEPAQKWIIRWCGSGI
jgi:protoporphyrinogen oxidase